MRAVRVHQYDSPPTVDEVPDPRIEGPLDVLVEVNAAGVCRTDLHIVEGQWADKSGVQLPYVLGHENAGTVVDTGSAVTNVSAGDRVILHPLVTCGLCRPCRAGDDVHCEDSAFPGISTDGGMATYLRTNARACVVLDQSLAPAEVAALADAGLTAYHAARKAVPLLHPGAHVVLIGAGGLGHIGIQVLQHMSPADLTVVDRSPEVLSVAEELGARTTVVADGEHVAKVLDATDGKGAHVVLDFVGEGGTEQQGIAMTRDAGSYFVIGYGGALGVATIDVISREINVIGNLVGSYNDLQDLMALAARGRVRQRTHTYSMDRALQAFEDLEHGRLPGMRAVLEPAPL